MLRKFLFDQSGATSAEYALILCIVLTGLGAATVQMGRNVAAGISGAASNVYETTEAAAFAKAGPVTDSGEAAPVGGGNPVPAVPDDPASSDPAPGAQPNVPGKGNNGGNGNHYGQCKKAGDCA